MDDVTIRMANEEDVPQLIGLLAQGALDGRQEDLADQEVYRAALAEIRATPGNDLLVAELDGRAVGMCQLLLFRHLQRRGGRCAEIESMHVDSSLRSKGIGAQLLAGAVEFARQAGCYRVQLTSNLRRPDAHRFYQREGFDPSHVGFKRYL
jgi:GNAT superfamily N-acetyltransferase